jgi:hypothetical protein
LAVRRPPCKPLAGDADIAAAKKIDPDLVE